jgi:tRNA A-37 threonylcarbamoyl transferase component Bud32
VQSWRPAWASAGPFVPFLDPTLFPPGGTMIEAPIPDDEEKRLALLRACNIMDTPAEAAFDDVVRLAADICGTEIALITLVGSDRQWFKARVGVEVTGTPRDLSFCGHCITGGTPLVVHDTHEDPRFRDNPLVTGEPHLRFYAGVPLEVEPGSSIGALSVADRTPRTLSPRQLDSLRRLARQVEKEIRLRRDLDEANATLDLEIGAGAIVGGRWTVARELGRGGVGSVFEASDASGARVAIKVLLPDWLEHEQAIDRFAREARVLSKLETPHVGKLLDVGNLDASQGGMPYLVLELLDGLDLARLVEKRGPIPFRQAFHWCADACEGLAAAHAIGVIHRDIKPSNIFLAQLDDGPPIVKVVDFGIATNELTRRNTKLTGKDVLMGSPAYMSPEQMISSRDVDARSDVWSMGVTLYEILSGQIPFPGDTDLEIFANAMTKPPIPLADVVEAAPPQAEAILSRCLQRDRAARFQSIDELGSALRAAAVAR